MIQIYKLYESIINLSVNQATPTNKLIIGLSWSNLQILLLLL